MHDETHAADESQLADAMLAAAVFASAPTHAGGVILQAGAGHERETWLQYVLSRLPVAAPVRRVPIHINDERLLGGLDLATTLATGRPVAQRGILQEADGGILILPSAERLTPALASRLAAAMDLGAVALQRDGFAELAPARFGFIAFDEGRSTDESPPSVLLDRAALHVKLPYVRSTNIPPEAFTREQIAQAGEAAASVSVADDIISMLCDTASALGILSANVVLQALRVSRVLAALAGQSSVSEDHAVTTVRLVMAPRATRFPEMPRDASHETEPEPPQQSPENSPEDEATAQLGDVLIAAAKAALPPHLLDLLRSNDRPKASRSSSGKEGMKKNSPRHGRPVGVKSGSISRGDRLNVVETLRTAAPWQRMRRQELANAPERQDRIAVRATDFRIWKLKQRGETVTVFLVDASGSTAMQRLGEAKGAVEILLSECYSRRDYAALIAFSGRGSELLLPPTRSLARAKRNLSDLPGGGATPLASGIDAAIELCEAVRRKGQAPSVVMLTDGRANLSRDGKPGRARAAEDAVLAARSLRKMRIPALVIDTSAKPNAPVARIADAMGATYLPLAHADAGTLSNAIKAQADQSYRP